MKNNFLPLLLCASFGAGPVHAASPAVEVLYVSNIGNNTIRTFDFTGHDFGIFADTLSGAYALASDGSGHLYAAEVNNNVVQKIDTNGMPSVFASSGLNGPDGVVVDHSGNLYVANYYSGVISRFDSNGASSVFATLGSAGPARMALDTNDNLYVANYAYGSIVKFDTYGAPLVFASTGLSQPTCLAFDPGGQLYAANYGNNTIVKFEANGTSSIFATSGLSAPTSMVFDHSGNLYVANSGNNTIAKFDSNGVPSTFASTGLNTPYGLAVALVIPTAPAIITQPTSQTVNAGQSVSFSVVATGYPLNYQWRKDGVDIGGATGATFPLGLAQTNQAGNYTVVVSNSAGSVTSAPPAVLTVNAASPASSGAVVAWGDNTYGQTSIPVAAQSGVTAIAAGYFLTVALKTNGTVIGSDPVPVAAQNGVTAIAEGYAHTVALINDGSAVAWGYDSDGQVTVPVAAQNGVTAIAAGWFHTVALKNDGSVVAWGWNYYGQTTVPLSAQNGVTAIAAGRGHTVVLKNDGSVLAWGDNTFGQTNVPAIAQSGVIAIAAGVYHTVALKANGSVVAWGAGTNIASNPNHGQSIVPVAAQSGVMAIAAGYDHTVALKTNGTVVAWGDNADSQTTVPVAAQGGVLAIAAGSFHTVALVIPSLPVITAQPVSQTLSAWQSVTFTVAATGPNLSYQWRHDGTDIPGATNASYAIVNARTNDTGNYAVMVSNLFGSELSVNAMLNVLKNTSGHVAVYGSPDFDSYNLDVRNKLDATSLFAQVDQFIVRPGYPVPTLGDLFQYQAVLIYSGQNFNDPIALGNVLADYVDAGGGVLLATFAFDASGTNIQGRLVSGGYLPFTTGPQDQDTPLTLVPDQPAHPILAGVSSFHGGSSSYHNLVTTAPCTTLVAHWSNGRPLVATRQRTSGMVVGLNFYPPSSAVQSNLWQATTDGAILMANALRFAGQFPVAPAFSFTWSTIPSPQIPNTPFTVTIQARNASNQVVTNFFGPVALRDAATGGVASNSILPSPTTSTVNGIDNYTWGYSFTPSTNITVRAVRHFFGTKVSIWTDAGVLLVAQPVSSVPHTWVETPLTTPLLLTAGTRYRVASYTAGSGNSAYGGGFAPTFPNGTIDRGYSISGDAFPTNPNSSPYVMFVDLRYTAPAVSASMTPANSGNFTNGTWSGVIRVSSPATNLVLLADDGAGHYGKSNPFQVSQSNQPPTIVTQPASQAVHVGGNASFSPGVAGTPTFTYQWRRNGTNLANGGRINGATASVLTISNVIANDAGLYSVFVANAFGSALSSSAILTINLVDHFSWSPIPSPVSTLAPFAVSVQARDALNNVVTNFTGTVAVSAALAGNGASVPVSPNFSGAFVGGVWNGSLSMPQIAANVVLRADDGLGDFGLSAPFNVEQVAAFTVQPTNQNVLPGTNVTLVANAVGTGPVRYQWQFEGTNILDATNASYSFTGANLTNHHGNFSIVASDDLSVAVSSNAYIYVLVKPGVVQHIVSQSVPQGRSLTFTLVATGAPPLWYRWIKGGAGYATTSVPVLVITNIQASTILRVAVTNRASPAGTFSPGPNSFQSVNITMVPDADGDGLPDAWELAYFGNTTNTMAIADSDGDGMSNRDEYLAGTNPTDPLSYLKIDSVMALGPSRDLLRLGFNAVSNKTYTLQYRDAIETTSWSNLLDFDSAPTNRVISFTNAMPTATATRFYRLVTPRQGGGE